MDADDGEGGCSECGSPAPSSNQNAVENSSTCMTTVSRHYFGYSAEDEERGDGGAFFIDIIENMQEEYGMFVWPCSIVLAEYIWQQKVHFFGKHVIEVLSLKNKAPAASAVRSPLGAGTSLPGLVATRVGANVILTDNRNRLEVLDNMRRMCQLNKVHCDVSGITWGEWDDTLFSLNPNMLLGADVFYDTSDFEDLFATVTFLLKKSPGSLFITTYHNRSGHHLIEYLMAKWGWKCIKLLDAFDFMPTSKSLKLQGNIQLVEITLDGQRNEYV